MMASVYDFTVEIPDGGDENLAKYKGQVLLIVNTASKCGFATQFDELEKLHQIYKEEGFAVLGFPSDQFKQEYEDIQDTLQYCRKNYGVTFPMFAKVNVNGPNADPLYGYLKEQQTGLLTEEIKWNFTKFLIDRKEKVIKRYAPATSPKNITQDIEKALADQPE